MGAAAGLFAAMGLGGGFVLLIYLLLFGGGEQLASQGQNLIFFIPVTAVSIVLHIKHKLLDVKTALLCGAVGLPFVWLGYRAALLLEGGTLKTVFAVFILLAGLKDLLFKPKIGSFADEQRK